jgi:transcriptional regulator with XRE-family HTH domain
MMRKERLKEVYEYVRKHFPIHTQADFADEIRYNRAYLSSAMNGNEKNLTNKLFNNICEAFPGVFNLEYLLTGKGSLLTIEEEVKSEEIERQNNLIDQSSLINAALAAKDETIAALRDQLSTKDELIAVLRQQIELLKQQVTKAQAEDYLKDFQFAPGVAEGHNQKDKARV